MSEHLTRRELVLATVADLVADFLSYDRQEDEELPSGEIEAAIEAGEVSVADIIWRFSHTLRTALPLIGAARAAGAGRESQD